MNEIETLWTRLRSEFSTALVAKIRKATVTAALNVSSFSILLPGEVNDRDGVLSVSPVVPQVGDMVRLQLVGDEPIIVAVEQRDFRQTGTTGFTLAGGVGTFPSGTVVAATSGTVTFPVAFTAAPTIQLTGQVGGNLDVGANVQSRSATTFGWRVFGRDPGTSWNGATGTLHWEAIGI